MANREAVTAASTYAAPADASRLEANVYPAKFHRLGTETYAFGTASFIGEDDTLK